MDVLREIEKQAQKVKRQETRALEERGQLYELFRQARAEGHTLRRIAESAGVSYKRVHQILGGNR